MWVEKIDNSATALARQLLTPVPHMDPVVAAVFWNSEGRRVLLHSIPGQPGLELPLVDNLPLIGNFDPLHGAQYIALALGTLATNLGIPEAQIDRAYGLLKPKAGHRQDHSLPGDELPGQAATQKIYPYLIHLRGMPQVQGYSWNHPDRAREHVLTGKSEPWQHAYNKILARADVLHRRLSKQHLQNNPGQSYSVVPQRGKQNERQRQQRS